VESVLTKKRKVISASYVCVGGANVRESNVLHSRRPTPSRAPPPSPVPIVGRDDDEVAGQAA